MFIPVNTSIGSKVIKSGNVLEVLRPKFQPSEYFVADSSPSARSRRSMMSLRRKISANAGQWYRRDGAPYWPIFATLTFARDVDVATARSEVYLFFKRVNFGVFGSRSGILKYSYVIEFTKMGRPHFHVLMYNLPFVPNFKAEFEKWWRNGFVRINKVNDVRNVGAYVVKYMSKDFHRTQLGARGRLFCNARLLLTPVTYNSDDDVQFWEQKLEGVWPWLYRKSPLWSYSVYYLGEDGLPSTLSPPKSPRWFKNHNDADLKLF